MACLSWRASHRYASLRDASHRGASHRRAPHRHSDLMGVYLVGMYLTGVHVMGVYLTGMYVMCMHLIGMHLMACTSWAAARSRCKKGIEFSCVQYKLCEGASAFGDSSSALFVLMIRHIRYGVRRANPTPAPTLCRDARQDLTCKSTWNF